MSFSFRKRFRLQDILEVKKQPIMEEREVEGRYVVDVTLTDAMQKYGATIGVRIREKLERLRMQGTGPSEVIPGDVQKEAVGVLGGLAVAAYLVDNWREAIDYTVIGKADEGDLIITIKEGSLKVPIDVKARTKPWNTCFMVPLWQFRKKVYEIYVSCQKLNENTFRLHGYTEGKVLRELVAQCERSNMPLESKKESDVVDSGVYDFGYGATITIPFTKLQSIRNLKAMMIL